MGVGIQRYADVCMTHDVLQCLGVHPGFCHIGTEGMSAHMRGLLSASGCGKSCYTSGQYAPCTSPNEGLPWAYRSCPETENQRTHLPLAPLWEPHGWR